MTTQTSIKVTLAYSTVAQMGFMLLQCGFGAFSSAGLHLAAHSLYKAHGFLASGTAVDDVSTVSAVADGKRPGMGKLVASLVIALVIFAGIGRLFAHDITSSLAVQTLGAIYIVGLFVFLAKGAGTGALLLRVAPVAAVAAGLYFMLQIAAASYFAAQVPPVPAPSSLDTRLWLYGPGAQSGIARGPEVASDDAHPRRLPLRAPAPRNAPRAGARTRAES